jgi:acyl-CoA reductase-like NAD-dependent aldehyde dehydrogenase
MSDSTFAFPRVRKEPLNDARHVRNAIARFDQVRDVSDDERDEAFRRIRQAAKKFGVEMSETRWQELGKPSRTRKSSDKPRTPTKAELAGSARSGRSKAELYAEARRRHVEGRSSMTKAELLRALETAR